MLHSTAQYQTGEKTHRWRKIFANHIVTRDLYLEHVSNSLNNKKINNPTQRWVTLLERRLSKDDVGGPISSREEAPHPTAVRETEVKTTGAATPLSPRQP